MTENESRKKAQIKRMNRKKNGLCTNCGKPIDREGSICNKCLEEMSDYAKKRRELLISIGICPICGQNEIFKNERSCPECKAKLSIYNKKRIDHKREYARQIVAKRREQGLCARCGQRKPEEGYKMCSVCREKARKRNRLKGSHDKRAEWKSELKCVICGKDERVEGKLVCEDCYRVRLAAIKKCNENRKDGYNQTWKDTNMKMRARYRINKTK